MYHNYLKLFLLLICTSNFVLAQNVTIKFATLAPDGSTWMNVMKEFSSSLKEKSADGSWKTIPWDNLKGEINRDILVSSHNMIHVWALFVIIQ